MAVRLTIVLFLLAVVLVSPFAFRPSGERIALNAGNGERIVIITPHNESIQSEFGRAFSTHMKTAHGRTVHVDWRQPGGTTEIARFLKSEFASRFETLWTKKTGLHFDNVIRDAFTNPKLDPPATQQGSVPDSTLLGLETPEERAATARSLFLNSNIGVGIDLFFGGGAYDFDRQAAAGALVATDRTGKYGPGAVASAHPEWFSPEVMPESESGEPFRDPDFRWVGAVLSAFGICYNTDVLARIGIAEPPESWTSLEDPRYFGQIALADPTKSGSTTKAFEMLVQERIQALQRDQNIDEKDAIREGWNEAMRLILRISANSRYFTDSAAKVPRDVAMGDAAAGMCIDFYGRTFNEIFRSEDDGTSRIQFVTPISGSSIGADPIGMLRGAPHPDLAHAFVNFVLSPEGQKLWNYRPGAPGGPRRFALRRPPIRKDFYTEANFPHMTDPEVNPYQLSEGFTYHPEWTASLFGALRFVVKAACMDPHDEQVEAWGILVERNLPAAGVAMFEDISPISYDRVVSEIATELREGTKVSQVILARELAEIFRSRYIGIVEQYSVKR